MAFQVPAPPNSPPPRLIVLMVVLVLRLPFINRRPPVTVMAPVLKLLARVLVLSVVVVLV